MQSLALAENIAADAVAAQAGVALTATPFYPGRSVVGVVVYSGNMAAAATVKIQSAPDNATWTDQLTSSTLVGKFGVVGTDNYMRANCTAAGTAGSKYSAYLLGGV
ncbi:MAG: hypothetical protein ACRDTS_01050 [Mycobacterium sp.]